MPPSRIPTAIPASTTPLAQTVLVHCLLYWSYGPTVDQFQTNAEHIGRVWTKRHHVPQMPSGQGKKRASFSGWLTLKGNPSQKKEKKKKAPRAAGVRNKRCVVPSDWHRYLLNEFVCSFGRISSKEKKLNTKMGRHLVIYIYIYINSPPPMPVFHNSTPLPYSLSPKQDPKTGACGGWIKLTPPRPTPA